jgi:hypothetical protein
LTELEIFGLYYRNQQTEDPFDDVYAVNTLKFAASECEDGEMELELDLYILYKAFKIGVWSYNSDTKTFNFDTDSCGFSLDNVDADQYGQPDTIFTALLQAQGACKTGTFTLMSFDYLLPDGGAFAVWNWTNILTMNYNNGGIYAPERGEGDPLWSGDVYQVVVMKSLGNTGWNNLSFKDDSGEILAHIMK